MYLQVHSFYMVKQSPGGVVKMASLVELRRYVDKETGEILHSQAKDLPKYFDPAVGYRMMARTKAVRMFPKIGYPPELSRTDMGHLLFLTQYMWANTGVLGEIKRRSFVPFDDDALLRCLGFAIGRKSRAWLRKMVQLSMLRSVDVNLPDKKERQWYMNPLYFCPMFITRQAYLIWRDQIAKYLPEYVKRMFDSELKTRKREEKTP